MGLLDPKSRVIDVLLTQEGRRKLAEGDFSVKFASFTDKSVVYELDSVEGHVDPTSKIYLEAFNAPYDQITFEADDSGKLIAFKDQSAVDYSQLSGSASWFSFYKGKIVNKTQSFSTSSFLTSSYVESFSSGSNFSSQIEGILTSSFNNFNNLNLIGSQDGIFDDQNFSLSTNEIRFTIFPNAETIQMVPPTKATTVDALFNDKKLRNVDNFMYLPPIKKPTYNVDKKNIELLQSSNLLLGNYPPWGPTKKLTFSDIKKELEKHESSSKTVYFDPTSKDNQISCQFFEILNSEVNKLDVIDYGKINDNSNNPTAVTNHVFFVGKVINDDTGSDCFIHLFTLVFGPIDEEEQ
jgi:hypothetical protein